MAKITDDYIESEFYARFKAKTFHERRGIIMALQVVNRFGAEPEQVALPVQAQLEELVEESGNTEE